MRDQEKTDIDIAFRWHKQSANRGNVRHSPEYHKQLPTLFNSCKYRKEELVSLDNSELLKLFPIHTTIINARYDKLILSLTTDEILLFGSSQ
ncbi:hypothetical protein [Thermophagus sp. OGC60D27]|uniref:hypothetical protein n=1 Tax=Thermophagus sp. OGC60D27 TaxID=3458415 RepID=UPI0040380770